MQGSLAGLAWPESQRHTASWQLPGGSRGIKRARSASTAGGPTLSPQQQDWQPWASAPTAASNRPPNRPQTSIQSGKGPAAQQHHSGGPGNDMMAPSSYPSPHGAPELDISRPAEPDLSHVPKRRRQAVGRPHAWMIAAHKSALGSGSTSNSPETSTPMAIVSTHDGSGQASLDSSPSIGRPSWPWDPEPKSSQAPESAQLRSAIPPTGTHELAQNHGSLQAGQQDSIMADAVATELLKVPAASADKGGRSTHSHRTQDEDDEDVAVSALWALSANATAENSPAQPSSPQEPGSPLQQQSAAMVEHGSGEKMRGQTVSVDEFSRVAAEAQARHWLSMATWGRKPAAGGMPSPRALEQLLPTHISKGLAADASSPRTTERHLLHHSSTDSAADGFSPHAPRNMPAMPGPQQARAWPESSLTTSGPSDKPQHLGAELHSDGDMPQPAQQQSVRKREASRDAPQQLSSRAVHLSVGRPASRLGPGRTGPKESDADGHKAGTSSFEGRAHAKGTDIPKASDINGHTESIDAARATPEERPDVDKGPVDQLLRTEAASTQKPLSPLLAMDTSSRCSSQGHSRAHSEG